MNQCHPGLQIVLDREAAIAAAEVLSKHIYELSRRDEIRRLEEKIEELEDEIRDLEEDAFADKPQIKCFTAERAAILRAFALVPCPGQLSLFEAEAG
jgi:cell division protein FtsB